MFARAYIEDCEYLLAQLSEARKLAEEWRDHAESLREQYDADPYTTGINPGELPWEVEK